MRRRRRQLPQVAPRAYEVRAEHGCPECPFMASAYGDAWCALDLRAVAVRSGPPPESCRLRFGAVSVALLHKSEVVS